jgi:hypothetical protein
MNEELKGIPGDARIKTRDKPQTPQYIVDLEEMGERCIKIAEEENPEIAILVLIGIKVDDGMYDRISVGGRTTNILRLLRFSEKVILEGRITPYATSQTR